MGDSFFSSKRKTNNMFYGKKWRGYNSRKNARNDSGIVINDSITKMTTLSSIESKGIFECPSAGPPMEKTKPELQYSRETLVELMNHPLSRKKPQCLESSSLRSIASNRNKNGNWEQSSDSHTEDEKNGDNPKKKSSDKAKKEQDVVLCPQRRSFNSGCYVNSNLTQNRNSTSSDNTKTSHPGSPSLPKERESHTGREMGVRRIGSGRIMSRDPMWDFHGESESERNQMFDKRSMDRRIDNDSKYQRDKGNRYGSGNDRKRILGENNRTEEEPEWFSGGPTSQHDKIELRGFDESLDDKSSNRKNNKKSNSRSNKKNAVDSNTGPAKPTDENALKKFCQKKSPFGIDSDVRLSFSSDITTSSSHVTDSTSDAYLKQRAEQNPIIEDGAINPENAFSSSPKQTEFSLEDFLKFDSIPGIMSKQGDDAEGRGSRFSRWFKQESEISSGQLSISNDSSTFNNMVNDITGHSEIKPEADNFFTPISPESTMKLQKPRPQLKLTRSNQEKDPASQKASSLLEILHGGNANHPGRPLTNIQDLEKSGKVHSVEELEAQLRRPTQNVNKEDEMAAFKKLLTSAARTIKTSFPFSSNRYQPTNLFQVINKTVHANKMSSEMKEDSNASYAGYQQHQQNQQNYSSNNMDSQMQIPQDLVMKLLHIQQLQQQQQHQQQQLKQQQQQQQFAKLLGSSCNSASRLTPVAPQFNTQSSVSPLPPDIQVTINNAQPTPELLQRPEAQALIIGLKRGQITVYNLIEQLKKNPALQPRHREVLASIIKIHQLQTAGGGNNQRTASPAASNTEQMLHKLLLSQQQGQHQQQLRAPSPHNNALQRVPSPRELVAHTQNIMQSALIRKKLEEQRDNFRKRQEMQRQAVHYYY